MSADSLPYTAGLPEYQRQAEALLSAAKSGSVDARLRFLLDAGEDPDRYNPEGHHAHSTPLHQAVWSNHLDVVQLLVERGARLDITDHIYRGTPLDWAVYGGRAGIADYLRRSGSLVTQD